MNDGINALFELAGAVLLIHNCRILYRDKQIQGVSVLTTAFFTAWGFWNLFFYPANGLWLSFAGGICLASVNFVWVLMALYYGLGVVSPSTRPTEIREFRLRPKPAAGVSSS